MSNDVWRMNNYILLSNCYASEHTAGCLFQPTCAGWGAWAYNGYMVRIYIRVRIYTSGCVYKCKGRLPLMGTALFEFLNAGD